MRVGWEIPELSAETRKAAGESDATQRRALDTNLQTELQQNSPFVTILQAAQQVAVRLYAERPESREERG